MELAFTGHGANASEGQSLAVFPQGHAGIVKLWHSPPRKPLSWFALPAAVLALALAGMAWRRSRRVRREVA
jgi:hypothetical protein